MFSDKCPEPSVLYIYLLIPLYILVEENVDFNSNCRKNWGERPNKWNSTISQINFFFLKPHQPALKLYPCYTVQILIYPFAFIYYHPPCGTPNHSELIIF